MRPNWPDHVWERKLEQIREVKKAVSEAGSTSPWIALAVAILFYLLLAVAVFSKAPPTRAPEPTPYSRAVNNTLDTVMWVHEQHNGRKMTWAELNTEVCRHMRVQRTEPWER